MDDIMPTTNSSPLPPKQLKMAISAAAVRLLPDVTLPAIYSLRTYQPGDEQAWIDLLDAAGFEGWDLEKFTPYMAEPERQKGSYLAVHDTRLVAATFASQRHLDPPEGALDYVICHPDYRNQKLGRAVCTAVLKYLAGQAYETITLATDDWRLPAIKLYLNLGFKPVLARADMPSRWEKVYQQLACGVNP
jgi:mycothiol synthase